MGAVRKGAVVAAACAALFAATTATAATVDSCRGTVGFKANPGGGAWGAVQNNGDSFLARRMVQNCEVKVVGTSVKAKPPTTTEILPGPMTQDECSMYNYLSSVDSKLNQAKIGEAFVTIGAMIAKVNDLSATGKLGEPGNTAILTAATAVQSCIADLM